MITTITPKILILLFRKLKSQTIPYDLSLLPNSSKDRASGESYCVGWRINSSHRLVFRRVDDGGWSLPATKKDITFDPKENISNISNRYWNVQITPEIARELLRQRKENKL